MSDLPSEMHVPRNTLVSGDRAVGRDCYGTIGLNTFAAQAHQ